MSIQGSAESIILSLHAESIILSAGGAKQQSTISCSGKCGNDGSSRGNSGGGNGFDVDSGNNNCSDDRNSNSDGDGDSGDGDSCDNDINSNSGGGNSNSGGKNNNQLKPAAEKVVTAVSAALASIILAS